MMTYKPVYSVDHEPKGGPMRFIGAALIVLFLVALVAAALWGPEPAGVAQPVACEDCDDEWDDDDDGPGVFWWFGRPFHWWFWTSPKPAHTHVTPSRAEVRSTAPASPSVSSPSRVTQPASTTGPRTTAPAGRSPVSSPSRPGGFGGFRAGRAGR